MYVVMAVISQEEWAEQMADDNYHLPGSIMCSAQGVLKLLFFF